MSEKELQDFRKDLKSEIVSTLRWYLTFSFAVVLALGSLIGWVAVDHLKTKEDFKEFKYDYSHVIQQVQQQHPDNIVFKEFGNKYNPYRTLRQYEP